MMHHAIYTSSAVAGVVILIPEGNINQAQGSKSTPFTILASLTMSPKYVKRVTLFKVPKEEDIDAIIAEYATMRASAQKVIPPLQRDPDEP
jgi:hypothetical protein